MENISAEAISVKVRALKHCKKLLEKINKQGEAIVSLNCTGVKIPVKKGDVMYLKIAAIKAQLEEQICSYEIISRKNETITKASDILVSEEKNKAGRTRGKKPKVDAIV